MKNIKLNKIAYLIVTLFILISCVNQEKPKVSITDKIKTTTEIAFENNGDFNNVVKGEIGKTNVTTYDENNNKIEIKFYTSEGSYNGKISYKYDEKNRKIEEINYFPGETLSYHYTYKYTDSLNTTKVKVESIDNRLISNYVYTYDDKKNKIEEINYSPSGTVLSKYKFEYDEKGNKTREYVLNWEDKINYEYHYSYDDNVNVVEEIVYDSEKKLFNKTTSRYEYNSKNDWVLRVYDYEMKSYETKRKMIKREIEYY